MPDREKVIKGLECLAKTGRCLKDECVYFHGHSCLEVVQDAIDLLKEQEAVRPTILRNGDPPCYCGKCGYPVKGSEMFCAHCGRGINWSD